MTKSALLVFTALLFSSLAFSQTIENLYQNKNYNELIKYADKPENLTGRQLYMVGYAFYRFENDKKAIEFYDKALAKVPDDAAVHFYKGLSLFYLKQFDDAMKEIDIAINYDPTNQEYVNQKGLVYYRQDQKDKALEIFEQAEKLPKTFPEPFYWAARIYHEKQEFEKALTAFYVALDNLPKTNSNYMATLTSIGQLEFTFKKNYLNAAKAYSDAISLNPKNYVLYPKLMKAFNEAGEFSKADSIFTRMKIAYNNKELPEEDMKFKDEAVDEYKWNGQRVEVLKSLVAPEKVLDVFYKVYLINKEGDKVERTFLTEKTAPNPDNTKYLLCETNKTTGMHYTYPYGWKTETIPLEDLKKAIGFVLDGKMEFGAASKHK